jgi:hypothetical protein
MLLPFNRAIKLTRVTCDEMWHVLGKKEMHTKLLWKYLKEINHMEVKHI